VSQQLLVFAFPSPSPLLPVGAAAWSVRGGSGSFRCGAPLSQLSQVGIGDKDD
jgi:hypothetical protein